MNRWKKLYEKIKIIESTFYFRYTFWLTFFLIAAWVVLIKFFNLSLESNHAWHGFLYITDNPDSVRYLVSSAFQGLAALFALTISVSFVVAQLASTYSQRLVIKIIKKKWFIIGLLLFVSALAYNLILLSLIKNVIIYDFRGWLFLGNMVDIACIVYIFPFIFLFIRSIDPHELAIKAAENFNEEYFGELKNKNRVNDSLPLFQTIIIKSLENGDSDLVSVSLNVFFENLKKSLDIENYYRVLGYFKPFFHKIIRKATEKREEDILWQIIGAFEYIQEGLLDRKIMIVSQFDEERASSLPCLINFLINESIKNGEGEMVGKGFGAMSRLGKKFFPLMPADSEIAKFRLMQEIRNGNARSISGWSQPEHNNEKVFDFIEDIFVVDDFSKLAKMAIRKHDLESASWIIRQIFGTLYDVVGLNSSHAEAKNDILGSVAFRLEELLNLASEADMDIASDIVTETEGAVSITLKDANPRIREYYLSLMLNALKMLIEKEFFTKSPEYALNMAGASVRGFISQQNKEAIKMVDISLGAFFDIVRLIDVKSKKTINTTNKKIREEVARQLRSFQKWKLEMIDKSLNEKIIEFLEKNYDKSFLDSLEKSERETRGESSTE